MLLFSLFLASCQTAEIRESIICICNTGYCSWNSGDECYNTDKKLDPRNNDFFEQFEDAREGNKNVVIGLYYSSKEPFDFPLKYLKSMNVRVVSTYYTSSWSSYFPPINFVYSSSDDVSTLNLTLDAMTANFINTDKEPTELDIKIGHIRTNGTRTVLNFFKNGNAPIKLIAKTASIGSENMDNLTNIELTSNSLLNISNPTKYDSAHAITVKPAEIKINNSIIVKADKKVLKV